MLVVVLDPAGERSRVAEFLVDVRSHTSVRGLPFSTVELADVISTTLEELS